MPLALAHPGFSVAVRLLAVSATISLTAGCAGSPSVTPTDGDDAAIPTEHRAAYPVPVVRYGRYTLVEVRSDAAQQDLLDQIVDISLPRAAETTVGDALHIVLQRTGYRLCEADAVARVLYPLPLPAVHLELGPLTLRDALRILAGPAWTLDIDSVARRVCFERKDELDAVVEPSAARSEASSTEQPKGSPSNPDGAGSPRRRRR